VEAVLGLREKPGENLGIAAGDRSVRGLVFRLRLGRESRVEVAVAFGRALFLLD